MAQSPTHKFGQIIGEVLEGAIEPCLHRFSEEHGLFLDKKGPRLTRSGKKVSWKDQHGNTHDLDFVLERQGGPNHVGIPVAFIETAWRRYTKHSRNKAQEIQGAIIPLAETYHNSSPFKGVVLAGVFTDGALQQLRSLGFAVLYFPYESIVQAFDTVGIDARFEEDTSDDEVERKIDAWKSLPAEKRDMVSSAILKTNDIGLQAFMQKLSEATERHIISIKVVPLHGAAIILESVNDAIALIEAYDQDQRKGPFVRYEIEVRYNNGDKVLGSFGNRIDAIDFLRTYELRNKKAEQL